MEIVPLLMKPSGARFPLTISNVTRLTGALAWSDAPKTGWGLKTERKAVADTRKKDFMLEL